LQRTSQLPRRVYTATPQRKKLQQEALLRLRAAREQIDPALLQQARDIIMGQAKAGKAPSRPQDEPVDKAQTLTVLKQYLDLMKSNKDLCRQVYKLIATPPE
jgi:hypothetical protein